MVMKTLSGTKTLKLWIMFKSIVILLLINEQVGKIRLNK